MYKDLNRTYMKLNSDSLKEFFRYSLRYYEYYNDSISILVLHKISIMKDIKKSVDPMFAALIAAYARRCVIVKSSFDFDIVTNTDCPLCKIFKVRNMKYCFNKFIDTKCFGGEYCFYKIYKLAQKHSLSKNEIAYKIVCDEIKKRHLDVEPLWLPRLDLL